VTIHSPAGPYTVLDGQDLRLWLAQADETRVFTGRTADRGDVEWIDAARTDSKPAEHSRPPVSAQGLNVVAALGIASAVVTHPEFRVAGLLAIFAVMVGARSRRIGLPVLAAALLSIVITAGFTTEALLALTSWTMAILAAWGLFSAQAAWLSRCSAVLPLGTALVNPAVTVPSTVAVACAAAAIVWVFAREGDANRTSSGVVAAACAAAIMFGTIVAPNVVTTLDGIDAAGSPPTTRAATFSAGALDLSARGPLPETALWTVPDSGPQLWRSAVYDTYDGQWWTNIPDLPQQPTTIDLELAEVGGTDEVRASPTTAAVIGSPAALGTPGVSPGVPLSIVTEGDVIPDASGSFFVQPDPLGDGLIRYTVTGLQPPIAAENPARSPTALPNVARWEQLPPLTSRVQDLAAQLRRPSPQQTANAVSDYLRQNLTYTLDSPRPAEGQDAVDHTLFEARSGFCEQFSTAQVVLMRANGIPARLVTGFSGGQANGATRTLRGIDAHAWVEYWDDTNGWLTIDPTAGATEASEGTGADLRPYAVAGLLLLVVMAAWFSRRVRARRRSRMHDKEAAPLLDAFHAREPRAAGQGTPRRPGETIERFGQRLHPKDPALFDLVEQTAYGVAPPSLDAQSDAAAELGALLAGGSR
jgi:transglutaminase-like putative cysteine protease